VAAAMDVDAGQGSDVADKPRATRCSTANV